LTAGVIAVGLFLAAPAHAIVGAAPADLAVESVSMASRRTNTAATCWRS
jgi:hypothetical protein